MNVKMTLFGTLHSYTWVFFLVRIATVQIDHTSWNFAAHRLITRLGTSRHPVVGEYNVETIFFFLFFSIQRQKLNNETETCVEDYRDPNSKTKVKQSDFESYYIYYTYI